VLAALAVRAVPALVAQVPVPAGPVVLVRVPVLAGAVVRAELLVLVRLPVLAAPVVRAELVVQAAASLQEHLLWVVPADQRSRPSFSAAMARTTV
jgi:hypothetical protein